MRLCFFLNPFLMLASDLASKEQFKAELEKVFNPALEQYLPLAFAILAIGYFFRKL